MAVALEGAGPGERELDRWRGRGRWPLARGLKMAGSSAGVAAGGGSALSVPLAAVEAVAADWMLEFACSCLCRHFGEGCAAQLRRWRDVALGEGGGGAQGLRPGPAAAAPGGQVSLPSARGSVLEHANFSTLEVLPHLSLVPSKHVLYLRLAF